MSTSEVNMTEARENPIPAVEVPRIPQYGVVVGNVLEVDPEDVLDDPRIKALRDRTGGINALDIPALAASIRDEGQDEPCGVYVTNDGLVMFEGERRREAIRYLRQQGEDIQLRVVVAQKTPEQAYRSALHSFTQHRSLKPLEFARSIAVTRELLSNPERTEPVTLAEIAGFYGVSIATITQHEKLLETSPEVQAAVADKRMSKTAALDVSTSPVDKQPVVVERAAEIAVEEQKRKPGRKALVKTTDFVSDAVKGKRKKKGNRSPVAESVPAPVETELVVEMQDLSGFERSYTVTTGTHYPTTALPESVPEPVPVIQSRHVRAAQRETDPDAAPKAPRMSEAIALIEQWDGPGYPDVMRAWARSFVEYGHGKSRESGLKAAWDDIANALAGSVPAAVIGTGLKRLTATQEKVAQARKVTAGKSLRANQKSKAAAAVENAARRGAKVPVANKTVSKAKRR